MKVLFCEEDTKLALEIKRNIELIQDGKFKEKIELIVINSVICMNDYLENEDVVIDVVMLNMNHIYKMTGDGIKVAKTIISEYKNINVMFYTNYLELRQDIFDIRPIYIFKIPINKEDMMVAIKKLYDEVILSRNECFVIKGVKGIYRIRKDDVVYIESQGRYIQIYTSEERIVAIKKIEQVMEMLGDNFIQCHKSFCVNMNKIKKMEQSKIIMFNGAEIQISRKYHHHIKEVLFNEKKIFYEK